MTRQCRYCEATFNVPLCQLRISGHGQFCSRACHYASRGRTARRSGRYVISTIDRPSGARQRAHTVIAEAALGHRLPVGAQVHHVDGDGYNNVPSNLVICQDAAYHQMLHLRQKVKRAGGDPFTSRFCDDCKSVKLIPEFSKQRRRWLCKRCAADRQAVRRERKRTEDLAKTFHVEHTA